MAMETWIESQFESYQRLKKWYLMPPCLTLSIIRSGSRVKWGSTGKGVVPSPISWCCSYQKGSFQVTLDYSCQLYYFFYLSNNYYHQDLRWQSSLLFLIWRHVGQIPSENLLMTSQVVCDSFLIFRFLKRQTGLYLPEKVYPVFHTNFSFHPQN